MNISRNFMLIGVLFLIVGIAFGMHMSASGNHTMTAVHVHINLLGFVLMTLFGLVYRTFPAMASHVLAKVHFWLHLVGSIVLLVMLYLLLAGRITEAGMVPLAPISEVAILLGIILFGWNLWQNGK